MVFRRGVLPAVLGFILLLAGCQPGDNGNSNSGNICCYSFSGPLEIAVSPNSAKPHQPFYTWILGTGGTQNVREVSVTRGKNGPLAWDAFCVALDDCIVQATHGERPAHAPESGDEKQLAPGVTYRVTVRASDPALTSYAEFQLNDADRVSVTAMAPPDNATAVPLAAAVAATFSVDMDPTTITAAAFGLASSAGAVTGSVAYDAPTRTATFTPGSPLAAATVYTATVAYWVQSASGEMMAANAVWTFTTQ